MGHRIITLEHLKDLTNEASDNGELLNVYVRLNGGIRSGKLLSFDENDNWNVINEIDDSEQLGLTDEQLKNETNIVEAIEKYALFTYD